MKKILLGICALGLLVSCDPSKDSVDVPDPIAESRLNSEFTYKQCAMNADGSYVESATGNFFFFTSPRVVTIYRENSSGGEIILSKGSSSGMFILKPTRGSDPNQTFYVRSREFNGSDVVISKQVTVEVPGELTLEMKIACSDSGTKIWKWDGTVRSDGAVWGNLGYTPGEDWTSGIWWGCSPEDLTGQLNHSDTHVATGEESSNAYMLFSEEGTITTYDGAGNQIRKGAFEIKDYNNGERIAVNDVPWKVGTLHTDPGVILFPFKINGGGTKPTDFDIVKLTADKMQLTYADAGTGSWSEATWWTFCSNSDGEGMLNNYGENAWTWDTEFRADGAVWGNLGYTPGEDWTSGIWWGCPPGDLTGQLNHSDTKVATGEEDAGAYMIFNNEGQINTYKADGTKIRGGGYTITYSADRQVVNDVPWNLGTLTTDPGVILFPFKINGGGTKPTTFEIVKLTGSQLQLVYADPGTGSWSEATWWAFKKK